MKKILVPTDFSPASKNAGRVAVKLAAKMKFEIILYHAYTPLENPFVDSRDIRSAYNERSCKNLLNRLNRLRKKMLNKFDMLKISTVLDNSPLIPGILRTINQSQINFIIMGTQGASGIKKTILGSNTASLINKASIPVLMVPHKYKTEQLNRVVFATSCQQSEIKAFRLMNKLIKPFLAEVTVLHVFSSKAAFTKEKADFDTFKNTLTAEFKNVKLDFRLMESSSIILGMETLDESFPYDLMVLVRKKKTIFEKIFVKSLTRNMALLTHRLLLVIPQDCE